MLVDEGGRYQSVRTEEEEAELFLREIELIPAESRELAFEVLNDYLINPTSPIVNACFKSMYKTPPCRMGEFLENPFYMGSFSRTIYNTVKSDLTEVFEGNYTQALLGGSLGGGKSTAGVIAMIRMIYEASCLTDPHETYNISSSDYIMFPGISSSENTAERVIIDKIKAIIEDSDYFQKYFKPEKNSLSQGLLFPNKILIPPGASSSAQLLGGNIAGLFIDESNFFQKRSNGQSNPREAKENIEVIYEAIIRRMDSRFKKLGRIPGIVIIASSKTTPDSFTERLIRKSIGKPTIFVRERSVWETQSSEGYTGKTFRVAIGTESKMSKILKDTDFNPDGMKVIDVPIEFREPFEDDVDASIRDFAGYFTVSITPFIARREKIFECIDKERVHPFNHEVWEQGVPGRIDWPKLCKQRTDGTYEPLHCPTAPRHVHLDLSKNHDRTGITVGCVKGYKPIQRFGQTDIEMAPVFHIDFMLAIQAPPGGEICYADIRKLIYEFSEHGFYVKLISADQFQSLSLLQTMRQQGYKTEIVSVEPAGGPYELFKQALYENRVEMYHYPPLIKELKELQKDNKTGKVDHPPANQGGSKDVADAIAAMTTTLSKNATAVNDTPVVVHSREHYLEESSDQWILGTMIAVGSNFDDSAVPEWRQHVESTASAQNVGHPEWRENAEKALEQEQASNYDWKRNFSMPFLTG